MFIRTDEREFLFFGDLEEGGYSQIWREAAQSWSEGRLAGIFVSLLSPSFPSLPSHPITPEQQAYLCTPFNRRRPSLRSDLILANVD